MGKKGKKKLNRRSTDCSPTECGMQQKLDMALEKFAGIAQQLTENHQALRENVIALTENVKGVQKMEHRLDVLEGEVRKNSALVYKIVGIGMAVATVAPFIFQHISFTIG